VSTTTNNVQCRIDYWCRLFPKG